MAISLNFVNSGGKKFFFLVFLVELQLYFTEFLKVYATVPLLKKYLASKYKKTFHFFLFFCNFMNPLILIRKFSQSEMSLVHLTFINFWKIQDDLKACLEIIWLPRSLKNVKFSAKMHFFFVLDPLKNWFFN